MFLKNPIKDAKLGKNKQFFQKAQNHGFLDFDF